MYPAEAEGAFIGWQGNHPHSDRPTQTGIERLAAQPAGIPRYLKLYRNDIYSDAQIYF